MVTLFYLFSTGAWVSAALVLRSKNPVHSVFYLVLVFLHASGLLCLLGLEFFALLQLLVYVGALAVMFLFVVMLLDIPVTEIVAHQRGTYPVAAILTGTLGLTLLVALWQPFGSTDSFGGHGPLFLNSPWSLEAVQGMVGEPMQTWPMIEENPLAPLGVAMYGVHVDLLLIASLLLLVAMVGAVALTLKRRVEAPAQDVFAQHSRDFQKVVVQVGSPLFERV